MNRRIVIASITLLLLGSAISCRYVMPERYVDYNKGRVPVDLPRDADNADIDSNIEKSSAVIVTISSDGKIYLGTEHSPVRADELKYKVHELAAHQREDDRMAYLAIDVAANYGAVIEACDAIRAADVSSVGVLAFNPRTDWPGRMIVELPAVPNPSQEVSQLKPNPLTLWVTITSDLKVKLNQDDYGSMNDLRPLSEKLGDVFRERRDEHAYRQGYETRTDLSENERVEKTVNIEADRKIKFGDVAKVINALRGAGASPIILAIDGMPKLDMGIR